MQTAAVKFQSVLQLKLLRVELFGCQVSPHIPASHPAASPQLKLSHQAAVRYNLKTLRHLSMCFLDDMLC